MKSLSLYLLFIIFLFGGCSRGNKMRKLCELAILSETYPDSTLLILETAFVPKLMNDKELVEWCMLNGRIRNDRMMDIDIDTLLLRRTINYYNRKHLPGPEAQARLYYGRSCVYHKQYHRAVPEYLIALNKAKEAKDDNLFAYINSYLADVYYEENNYEDAFACYEKGAEYFLKANNMKSYGFACRDMGIIYILKDEKEKAFEMFEKADSIAKIVQDSLLVGVMLHNIGAMYLWTDNYELAEEKFLESIVYRGNTVSGNLALTEIYEKKGDYELAFEYLEKVPQEDDLTSMVAYWRKKFELYKNRGNYEEALVALETYVRNQNKLWNEKDSMKITEAAKKFDYTRIAEENVLLTNESNQRLVWMLFLLITSLLVYIFNRHVVAQKDRLILQKQKELEAQEQLRKENDLKLKAKELELDKKSLEYQRQQNELELLKNKEYIAKQSLLKRSLTFKKLNMLSELPPKNINAFKEEVEKVLGTANLSENDWEEIKNEINYVYSDFTNRISNQIPRLTEEEIRFCCLLKVGLDTSELAVLLRINPESVNRRRTRINKKIREVYPESSWYEFLKIM